MSQGPVSGASARIDTRDAILAGAVCLACGAALIVPPMPQPLAYHDMADQRTWLGIPHALNVLSNLPFAVVGVMALRWLLRTDMCRAVFHDPWERWPYVALFAGVALTSAGSAYYHLAPDNQRLVWDRLPMTVGFMGLLTAVLAERVSLPVARRLFAALLLIGGASVGHWYWTEIRGAGDLRFYGLVQFGSLIVVVLLMVLYRSRYAGSSYLVAGLATYGSAKGLELADVPIFELGRIVSGHTLKHLVAACAVALVAAMLHVRAQPSAPPAPNRSGALRLKLPRGSS
jgi:hypothetical protein